MLPSPPVPAPWLAVLETLRVFTAPSFETFTAMVTGLVAQTGAGTVTGMLTGAGLARVWPHEADAFAGADGPEPLAHDLPVVEGVVPLVLVVPDDVGADRTAWPSAAHAVVSLVGEGAMSPALTPSHAQNSMPTATRDARPRQRPAGSESL